MVKMKQVRENHETHERHEQKEVIRLYFSFYRPSVFRDFRVFRGSFGIQSQPATSLLWLARPLLRIRYGCFPDEILKPSRS
jgi:hypothetical protein